jgi:hypothetical protein
MVAPLLFNHDRKREEEGRALSDTRLKPDLPFVHLNNTLGDREPQARATLLSRD